jgi:hypothetical protein
MRRARIVGGERVSPSPNAGGGGRGHPFQQYGYERDWLAAGVPESVALHFAPASADIRASPQTWLPLLSRAPQESGSRADKGPVVTGTY